MKRAVLLNIVGVTFALLLVGTTAGSQDAGPLDDLELAASAYESALRQYTTDGSDSSIEELLRAAKRLLEVGEELYPATDARLAMLATNYGNALLVANQSEDARDVLVHALTILEESYGKDSPDLVYTIVLLADASAEPHNSSAQKKLYKRALQLTAEQNGKASIEYAEIELKAGRSILKLSGDFAGARGHMRGAYKTYSALLGSSDKQTGLAALYLAGSEVGDHKYKRAQDYLLAALEGLNANEPDTLDTHLYARSLLVRAYELNGKSDKATEHCVAIGRLTTMSPEQDYRPIFRLAPSYPEQMIRLGKEGIVELSFIVDEQGFVQSPKVSSLEGDETFGNAALYAVRRFRYAPRIENGEPIAVDNVSTKITFKIG